MIGLLVSEENEYIELVLYCALGRVILTEYGLFPSHEAAVSMIESTFSCVQISPHSYSVDVESVLKHSLSGV